ncbi:MAG TPA: preprotein translocase subunit SecA [bacterium]|nr:preprotein translocase subunit SecA [bacterium]
MGIFDFIFGDPSKKAVQKMQPLIDEINSWEDDIQKLSDDELKAKTDYFRKVIIERKEKSGQNLSEEEQIRIEQEVLEEILPEAFAVVREASKRALGMRHFDVQLIGGIVIHQGKIAEMKTGEGKTLVATLPLYLNALVGKGCHLVTVNDYLARRDADWMGELFHFLGMKTGVIQHQASYLFDLNALEQQEETEELKGKQLKFRLKKCTRREAYEADITYATNNELGFDYLRDNMVVDLEQMVQRPLYYAIVDEVDNILIDEARTPLIISAPGEEVSGMYQQFARIVPQLEENVDYNVDEKLKAVSLTEDGINHVEKILGINNIYEEKGIKTVHHLEEALKAQILFKKDRDYVVKNGEILIVDEFTGRLMPGRRYSRGLHQAIEAKEGVEIKRESKTVATITFQNYFRLYKKLAGMTGTAATEAEELSSIYKLDVIQIPTNKSVVRQDKNDLIYKTEEGKFDAVVQDIKNRNEAGQPVLVGTISVEKSEYLSDLLTRTGIAHNVLNAKNHEKESEIVANAGNKAAVTIATNMAGRGTDIKLDEEIKQLGGLHIIGTERHESRRIDNQLRGRSGRQGDPGSSQFFVSLEDDLMRIFGSDRIKGMMETFGFPEDQPLEHKMLTGSIESAQKKVEGYNFDIRKSVVDYDDVMNKHREAIYAKRRMILKNNELRSEMMRIVREAIQEIVKAHTAGRQDEWNLKEINENFKTIVGQYYIEQDLSKFDNPQGIVDHLCEMAEKYYAQKEQEVMPEMMRKLEKLVMLRIIDNLWQDHLDEMDYLRTGVGLRGYGQRDPLVEYKHEAFNLYRQLQLAINDQIAKTIFKVTILKQPAQNKPVGTEVKPEAKTMQQTVSQSANSSATVQTYSRNTNKTNLPTEPRQPAPTGKTATIMRDEVKVGRNEPCPCGSGKKYKKCHGAK